MFRLLFGPTNRIEAKPDPRKSEEKSNLESRINISTSIIAHFWGRCDNCPDRKSESTRRNAHWDCTSRLRALVATWSRTRNASSANSNGHRKCGIHRAHQFERFAVLRPDRWGVQTAMKRSLGGFERGREPEIPCKGCRCAFLDAELHRKRGKWFRWYLESANRFPDWWQKAGRRPRRTFSFLTAAVEAKFTFVQSNGEWKWFFEVFLSSSLIEATSGHLFIGGRKFVDTPTNDDWLSMIFRFVRSNLCLNWCCYQNDFFFQCF